MIVTSIDDLPEEIQELLQKFVHIVVDYLPCFVGAHQ
jgi:hypothetical protein